MTVESVPLPKAVGALANEPGSSSHTLRAGLECRPIVVSCGGWASRIIPRGATAWTLGRLVLIRESALADDDAALGLIVHEIVHVGQWHRNGRIRFMYEYVAPYLRERMRGSKHWEAYSRVPAEIEAYEVEHNLVGRR